ncbi:uncharacterized protein LOC144119806 [Amblyomma americanum]
MAGRIKSYFGIAAPFFLAPLLLFNSMGLLYAVLLVALFTVLQSLPLAVVSMCPWVGAALVGVSQTDYADLLTSASAEMVSLTGFLVVYVAVELTRLGRRLSLLLLRSLGLRVRRLLVSIMLVAFVASLVLPAAFVTLLLAACICRLADNMPDDAAVLSQQQAQLGAAPATQTLTTETRTHTLRSDDRLHQRLARSPVAKGSASRTPSPEEPPLPGQGFPWALVRMDDVVRQMASALRSACMESPQLRLLRARRRFQSPELADAQASADTSVFHASTATSRSTAYELSRAQTSRLTWSSADRQMPRSTLGAFRDQRHLSQPMWWGSSPGAPSLGASASRSPLRVARDSVLKKALRSSSKSPLGNGTPHSSHSRESLVETSARTNSLSPSAHPSHGSPDGQSTPPSSRRPQTLVQTPPTSCRPAYSETDRLSHGPSPSGLWTAANSPQMSARDKVSLETTVFRTTSRSPGPPSQHEHSVSVPRISCSENIYKRIQKVLIVGVAYTSIVAGECGFKSRLRFIVDAYYATIKKPSPFMSVYLTFLMPVTVLSIVLFWAFIYYIYTRDDDLVVIKECRVVIQKIMEEKLEQEGKITSKEVLGVLMLAAIGLSLAINTNKYIGADATTVSSLCALVAVGVPPELGNPILRGHVVTWRLVLHRLPWELVVVRLGGVALELLAKRSNVSALLLESGLVDNDRPYRHPVWCQVTLLAATALVSEVDTTDKDPRFFRELIVLADQFQEHPLYFALPVVLESRWVLLMPYTRLPLIFLHVYANISSSELLWLGLLLKVISCVTSVLVANIVLAPL